MFDSHEFQKDNLSNTSFNHHGAPSFLTEEDAIAWMKDAASYVRKREWCKATQTLDALQFAACLDGTPIGHPLLTRVVDTHVSPRGASLLALAVSHGAPTALIEQLINWGADPLIKLSGKVKGGEDTDLSLLHLAFANEHLELVPLLLQVGLKPDDRSGLGYDPLSYYLRSNRDLSDVNDHLEIALREFFTAGGSFAACGPTGASKRRIQLPRQLRAKRCHSEKAKQSDRRRRFPFTLAYLPELWSSFRRLLRETTRVR